MYNNSSARRGRAEERYDVHTLLKEESSTARYGDVGKEYKVRVGWLFVVYFLRRVLSSKKPTPTHHF